MKNCSFISIVARSVCIRLKVYDGQQQQVDETTLSQPVTFIHPSINHLPAHLFEHTRLVLCRLVSTHS